MNFPIGYPISRAFAIALLWMLCLCTQAQAPQLEELDRVVTEYARASEFNGNILIARDGQIALNRAYGLADFETTRALDTATVFRLASLSKQFTAIGIALLEADGLLAYDDLLAKHIPELAFYEGVTLRHLIHHYGGLPDYMQAAMMSGDTSRVHNNETIIEMLAREKPKREFRAGNESSYSNTGYLVLASVIERVSGTSYGEFLQERIFKPLGMHRTSVPYPNYEIDENRAWGYEDLGDGRLSRVEGIEDPVGYYLLANIVGDGMVHSTTGDLFRYCEGMRQNKLLDGQRAALLLQPGPLEESPQEGYAFGQQVEVNDSLGIVVTHTGSWVGYLTVLVRYPHYGHAIIILSNNGADFNGLGSIAEQYIRGDALRAPRVFERMAISAEQLDEYTGRFQLDNSKKAKIKFSIHEGQLIVDIPNNPTFMLEYGGQDTFFLEGFPLSMAFQRDESGAVTGLILTQRDLVINGEKL